MTQQQPTQEHRARLVREVRAVAEHYREAFALKPGLTVVADVRLRDREDTTVQPAIRFFRGLISLSGRSEDDPGVILIFLTPTGIDLITRALRADDRPHSCAAIAAIASIEPHRPRSEQ